MKAAFSQKANIRKGGAKMAPQNHLGITDTGRMEAPSRRFQHWSLLTVLLLFIIAGSVMAGLSQTIWKNPVLPTIPTQGGEVPVVPTPAPVATPTPTSTPTPLLKIEVNWAKKSPEVQLPQAEKEGLYIGTVFNGLDGMIGSETPEGRALALRILPDLKTRNVFVAASRHGDIVLVSMSTMDAAPGTTDAVFSGQTPPPPIIPDDRLFLSQDGEKSWKEIGLFKPETISGKMIIVETRVLSQGDTITLFVRSNNWWQANLLTSKTLP